MKKFFINFAIYYVAISLAVTLIWILTGFSGNIPFRILLASVLAFINPLYGRKRQ